MGAIKDTAGWAWDVITNPPVEWADGDTGEVVEREHWTRMERFHTFRPMWTHTAFTTNPGCGCRRRFGMWPTMTCFDHLDD